MHTHTHTNQHTHTHTHTPAHTHTHTLHTHTTHDTHTLRCCSLFSFQAPRLSPRVWLLGWPDHSGCTGNLFVLLRWATRLQLQHCFGCAVRSSVEGQLRETGRSITSTEEHYLYRRATPFCGLALHNNSFADSHKDAQDYWSKWIVWRSLGTWEEIQAVVCITALLWIHMKTFKITEANEWVSLWVVLMRPCAVDRMLKCNYYPF